jgi:hypothetical protein
MFSSLSLPIRLSTFKQLRNWSGRLWPSCHFSSRKRYDLENTVQPWEFVQGKSHIWVAEPLLTESSALYTLYDSTINLQGTDEAMRSQILSSMEPLSKQIAEFSKRLFGDGNSIDYGTLSPYVPYSLYQSAVVQHRLWNQTGHEDHKTALASLKEILGHFRKRWLIAGNDKCSCNNYGNISADPTV